MHAYNLEKHTAYSNITAYGVFIIFKQFGLCAFANHTDFSLLVDIGLIDKATAIVNEFCSDLREYRVIPINRIIPVFVVANDTRSSTPKNSSCVSRCDILKFWDTVIHILCIFHFEL